MAAVIGDSPFTENTGFWPQFQLQSDRALPYPVGIMYLPNASLTSD
jgi:hypothetical protein